MLWQNNVTFICCKHSLFRQYLNYFSGFTHHFFHILVTIHTNLKEYNHLMQSESDYIAGPVAELVVEKDEAIFEKPVELTIPHCVRTNKTSAVRVLCGTDRDFEVIISFPFLHRIHICITMKGDYLHRC